MNCVFYMKTKQVGILATLVLVLVISGTLSSVRGADDYTAQLDDGDWLKYRTSAIAGERYDVVVTFDNYTATSFDFSLHFQKGGVNKSVYEILSEVLDNIPFPEEVVETLMGVPVGTFETELNISKLYFDSEMAGPEEGSFILNLTWAGEREWVEALPLLVVDSILKLDLGDMAEYGWMYWDKTTGILVSAGVKISEITSGFDPFIPMFLNQMFYLNDTHDWENELESLIDYIELEPDAELPFSDFDEALNWLQTDFLGREVRVDLVDSSIGLSYSGIEDGGKLFGLDWWIWLLIILAVAGAGTGLIVWYMMRKKPAGRVMVTKEEFNKQMQAECSDITDPIKLKECETRVQESFKSGKQKPKKVKKVKK